jgi:hypothetical protein
MLLTIHHHSPAHVRESKSVGHLDILDRPRETAAFDGQGSEITLDAPCPNEPPPDGPMARAYQRELARPRPDHTILYVPVRGPRGWDVEIIHENGMV